MVDDVIKEAMDRFYESDSRTRDTRDKARDDIDFAINSEQWPDFIKRRRALEERPCLTINRLKSFIRQVVNDARQSKMGISISPASGDADEPTAKVIEGLIRLIERKSNASVAYDTAIEHAVTGGFGFFRVCLDYENAYSFDMEARIDRIHDPFSVHWDITSTRFDAADWDYAFVSEFLSKEQFKSRYPEGSTAGFTQGEIHPFNSADGVRVAEYWERTNRPARLFRFRGGMALMETEVPHRVAQFTGQRLPLNDALTLLNSMGLDVVQERETVLHEVIRRIITNSEILEEEAWPGRNIPICPVWGEEFFVDGERQLSSMVRDAKDPQRLLNYWRSASTELVALAPKAPFIGPAGFVPPGQEAMWKTANTRSYAYLEYEGQAAPRREPFAGVPAGVIQEALNSTDDMKAVTGIYDPSLGAEGNETSGRAIMARQRESGTSNFHFIDNLSRAITYAGEVLVDIIPDIYSPRETLQILGSEYRPEIIRLTLQDPQEGLYNLNMGKYGVVVRTGPSFASQREETRAFLLELIRAMPSAIPSVADILLDNMDFVGADKIAERLKNINNVAAQEADLQPQGANNPLTGVPPNV